MIMKGIQTGTGRRRGRGRLDHPARGERERRVERDRHPRERGGHREPVTTRRNTTERNDGTRTDIHTGPAGPGRNSGSPLRTYALHQACTAKGSGGGPGRGRVNTEQTRIRPGAAEAGAGVQPPSPPCTSQLIMQLPRARGPCSRFTALSKPIAQHLFASEQWRELARGVHRASDDHGNRPCSDPAAIVNL